MTTNLYLDTLKNNTRRFRRLSILFVVIAVLHLTTLGIRYYTRWHTGTPPPMQRVQVITDGYYEEGKWKAFDDGRELTVTQWKPKQ